MAERPNFPEPPDVPPYLPDGTPNPAWPRSYREIAAKVAWLAYKAKRRAAERLYLRRSVNG